MKKELTNKNFLIFNIALILLSVVLIWLKPLDYLKDYCIDRRDIEEMTTFPIYNGVVLEQHFSCPLDFDSFEIFISAANNSFIGEYRVDLYDGNDNYITGWIKDKAELASSNWIEFEINYSLKSNNVYKILISAEDLSKENALVVYLKDGIDDSFGEMLINSKEANSALCMSLYKKIVNFFAITSLIVLWVAANIWWFVRKYGIEKSSLPLLIGTGMIMFLIMSPGSGPDEVYHYYSAFELSNVMMGRQNLSEIEVKYKDTLPLHVNSNYAFVKTIKDLNIKYDDNGNVFIYDGVKDRLIQPLSHIGPALGVTLGRIMRLSFIKVYELGRIFNLSVYIILVWIAIRIVPVNKELLLMFGVLPMYMHQACQMSYDPVVNGVMMIFVAYVYRLIYESKDFSWKNMIVCFLLLGLISPIKVVYSLLVLLLFAVSEDQFGSKKEKFIKIIVITLGVFLILFISKWQDIYNVFWGNDYRISNDSYTPIFVIKKPFEFIKIIIGSIEKNGLEYMKEVIGYSLSGYTVKIPEYLVLAFWVIIVAVALSGDEYLFKCKIQKLIVIGTTLLGFTTVIFTFIFAYTPYGYPFVQGVQGRYFTPFIIPFLYCLSCEKICIRVNKTNLIGAIWFIEVGYIVSIMNQIYI